MGIREMLNLPPAAKDELIIKHVKMIDQYNSLTKRAQESAFEWMYNYKKERRSDAVVFLLPVLCFLGGVVSGILYTLYRLAG